MAEVVITSIPVHGHVVPLLTIAAGLTQAGQRVRFLTGARFADAVTATGAEHIALPPECDSDDREPQSERDRRPGIAGFRHGVREIVLRPAPIQYAAVCALLDDPGQPRTDVVFTDPVFVGSALLSLRPRTERPPVIAVSMIPLLIGSADVAPYGLGLPPLRHRGLNRLRNRALDGLARRMIFRPVQRDFEEIVVRLMGRRPGFYVLDGLRVADAVVQLCSPGFEYPRSDLTTRLEFVGPFMTATAGPTPPWWPDLDGERPVVLVTQGTLANQDLTALIRPTIDGLAETDVLVVVSTGGRPVAELGVLPDHVRAAEYLPYDRLFPKLDALVTNGGYGGVQYALAHGVPLVAAGTTEDKLEVGARVAWSGAGIWLRTDRPKAHDLTKAVSQVLSDDRHREAAGRLGKEIAAAGGLEALWRVAEEEMRR